MHRFLSSSILLVFAVLFSASSFADEGQVGGHGGTPKFLDLSRSAPSNTKVLSGRVVLKPISAEKDWPFFQVEKGDTQLREYKIEVCDETCRAEIAKCKGGETCEVRAEVREGQKPYILARTFKVLRGGNDLNGTWEGCTDVKTSPTPIPQPNPGQGEQRSSGAPTNPSAAVLTSNMTTLQFEDETLKIVTTLYEGPGCTGKASSSAEMSGDFKVGKENDDGSREIQFKDKKNGVEITFRMKQDGDKMVVLSSATGEIVFTRKQKKD